MNQAIEFMLLWLVAQAAMTDLALRRVPNVLVLCGLFIALVLHALAGGMAALAGTWLAGLATGFFLFLPLYALRGMAAGDVKLMAMVGAFAGPEEAVQIALLACLAGGAMGLAMVAWNGRWRVLMRNLGILLRPLLGRLAGYRVEAVPLARADSAGGIPYGVAIAVGTAVVVLHASTTAFA
jgi:prepilin peptidase CpaA